MRSESIPAQSGSVRQGPMMRAAVIAAPRHIRFPEVPIPQPWRGQVRVRLEGCGVCASNLPLWEGRPWFEYPVPPGKPGHEAWGRVDAIGAGVSGLRVGDRVAMVSFDAFAEFDVAETDAVVRLPRELDGIPFPGEPLGCAMNIYARSDIHAGDVVGIVGIGFLGAALTQLCARAGARVIAISRRPWALEVARRCGASETVAMDDHERVVEAVAEATGGRLCDRVIEAIGLQWPLDLAGDLTRERGRLIIAGYHQDGLRQVNLQLWNWRGLDVINAHERDPKIYAAGMRAAAAAVLEGRLSLEQLSIREFPFCRLGEALDAAAERPEGFLKAVVTI